MVAILLMMAVSPTLLVAQLQEKTVERAAVVIAEQVKVFRAPDSTSLIQNLLVCGDQVTISESCATAPSWCKIWESGGPWYYIRVTEIYRSEALIARYGPIENDWPVRLARELASASDPIIKAWLTARSAGWSGDDHKKALALMRPIEFAEPRTVYTPWAMMTVGLLQEALGEFSDELATYRKLRDEFPRFWFREDTCRENAMILELYYCRGSEYLPNRIDAIETFIPARANAERIIGERSASNSEKAKAWISLAEAWNRKNARDPGPSGETDRIDHGPAAAAYKKVIELLPHTELAGDAAWQLVLYSEPYEWEGDLESEIKWIHGGYGKFLKDYPTHPLVGEALYEDAIATWAEAGYTEVLGRGGIGIERSEADTAEQRRLRTWFVYLDFGSAVLGERPVTRHPDGARKALAMFRTIVTKYPTTKSAAMALYYSAVISDWCFDDHASALIAYRRLLREYATSDPAYLAKVRARVEVLAKQKT